MRACGELVGNFTLGFEERGANSILVADTGVPLGESTCISCGACVQVCPTGALIDRWSAYRGHDTQVDSPTPFVSVALLAAGSTFSPAITILSRSNGNWDAVVNEGVLCKIGRFEPMEEKCDRVATPMIRKNGSLKAATWEEAIAAAAAELKSSKKNSEDIAAVISTRQPVETLSAFKQLFGSKLGSTNVTSLEEGVFTQPAAKQAEELSVNPLKVNWQI